MTRLEQLQKSGIHRVGTPARGFKYKSAVGTKVSAADLKRIDELNGKMIGSYFNTLDELITYRGRKLHTAEKALLAFMRRSANS